MDQNRGNAGIFIRDIDDTTGAPIGPWSGALWPTVTGGKGLYHATNFFWNLPGVDIEVIGVHAQGSDTYFDNLVVTGGSSASFAGDFDGDGDVDGDDFLIWQNQFPSPGAVAVTPEPASLALLGLGSLALLRRRRQ